MKALLLAAGFGTRLVKSAQGTKHESLIKNTPKSLIPIQNKTVISHIIEKLEKAGISEIYLITNNLFLPLFEKEVSSKVKIINNNVNSLEQKKGAVKDIHFAIKETNLNDDLLIIGGDNLFSFNIENFINFFNKNKKDSIIIRKLKNKEDGKLKYGIVELENNKILSLEEKPEFPKTDLASTCLYLIKKETIPLIDTYLSQDNKHDDTGNFISWLAKNKEVLGWVCDISEIIDIGSLDQIEHLITEQ